MDLKVVLLQDARLSPLLSTWCFSLFFRDVLMVESMVGTRHLRCPLLSRFRAISAHLGWQALTLALNSQATPAISIKLPQSDQVNKNSPFELDMNA